MPFPKRKYRRPYPHATHSSVCLGSWLTTNGDQEFITNATPYPSDVQHVRTVPYSGPSWVDNRGDFCNSGQPPVVYSSSWVFNEHPSGISLDGILDQVDASKDIYRLPWESLVSSSKFGIIQFFAELDDTLATFTKKFWQELSYGSITWGVAPFISDMKNLFSAMRNSSKLLNGQRVVSVKRESVNRVLEHNGTLVQLTGHRTIRFNGFITVPDSHEILALLDRVGFHPDLATAWDLVPLSFMIDYFVPVGDAIDSLHSRGWIRDAYFHGWYSNKFVGRFRPIRRGNGDLFVILGGGIPIKTYVRRRLREHYLSSDVESRMPDVPYDLESVTATELLNTLYLSTGGGGGKY